MLRLKNISKGFPGVQALKGVSLEVKPGEIHGLLGENGAGKSTLIKIVAGAYTPDQGEMTFDGAPARWSSPREAKRHGVHVVYQEFVLFPQLSVAENIFVGHELRNRFGIVVSLFDSRLPAMSASRRNGNAPCELLEQCTGGAGILPALTGNPRASEGRKTFYREGRR